MKIFFLLFLTTTVFANPISFEGEIQGNNYSINYSPKSNGTGSSCKSDYSCASLCCVYRVCKNHRPSMGAFCAKSPGSSCVSRSYCRKQVIESCYIVKTGRGTCALRCYRKYSFMNCRNSRCTPLRTPPIPTFNPANPDCSEAIDPPLQ